MYTRDCQTVVHRLQMEPFKNGELPIVLVKQQISVTFGEPLTKCSLLICNLPNLLFCVSALLARDD